MDMKMLTTHKDNIYADCTPQRWQSTHVTLIDKIYTVHKSAKRWLKHASVRSAQLVSMMGEREQISDVCYEA